MARSYRIKEVIQFTGIFAVLITLMILVVKQKSVSKKVETDIYKKGGMACKAQKYEKIEKEYYNIKYSNSNKDSLYVRIAYIIEND